MMRDGRMSRRVALPKCGLFIFGDIKVITERKGKGKGEGKAKDNEIFQIETVTGEKSMVKGKELRDLYVH